MHSIPGRRAVAGVFHFSWLLLLAGLLWPSAAQAQTSNYCPAPLTATVAYGGSTQFDVSNCDGMFDAGMSDGPPATPPQNGSYVIGPNSDGVQYVTYTHDGDGAETSDTFTLADEDLNLVRFDITIQPPTSSIVVSPSALPPLVAGTPVSETFTASGGTGPYTWSLSSGALPIGLSLTGAGVLSGTPTQRGGFSFDVRVEDALGDAVVRGFNGSVLSPTLTLTTGTGTAVQGVAFSQTLVTTGGVAPHTYQLESGGLPAGISISPAGVVSGTTAAAPGDYPVVLRVTDSSTGAGQYFELETYTLTVASAPSLSIDDVDANEGDAGSTSFAFTVSLDAPAGPGGVGFDIATADGTGSSGSDYVASSLTGQTIPAGSSTYTFTVQVNGDATYEQNETFFVNVTNVTGAAVADGQGTGTILNDDPLPTIGIDDASVIEGASGTSTAVFTVSLDVPSGQPVSVNYATADGTATAPSDYLAQSGTVNFAVGQTSQTVTVPVVGDTGVEATETFFVNLSGPVGATIADGQGVGTVVNDDVVVAVSPVTLPNGAVAAPYGQTLSASGGTGPYTFAITAGALPPGLALDSDGSLAGTPSGGGSFNFTVTATDSAALPGPFAGSRSYTVIIAAPTIDLPAAALPDASLGSPYAASIGPATGGIAPYSYAITAGALPAGMTLSAADGSLGGTPTAAGSFSFSVTATDSSTGNGPYTATRGFTLQVTDPTPVANDSALTVPYGAPATAVPLNLTGGVPDSLAITTAPAHGTVVVAGVTITYQPDAGYAGADSFAYTASNAGGTSAPATVGVTVADAVLGVTASGPLTATTAAAYSQTFTFNGGAAPWSGYQVANLPPGLAITASGADSVTVSGTPSEAGTFALAVSGTDSSSGNGPYTFTEVFNLVVDGPALALAPGAGTLQAPYATAFSQAFVASGGVGPYTYALSGPLPAGMAFSGDTLSGTPTEPGSYAITVTATDTGSTGAGAPFTVSRTYALEVPAPSLAITPPTLPDATAGTPYRQAIGASGGVAPYTFAVTAGSLPAGLALAADGVLSGTPTGAGTFDLTVTANDANGQSVDQAYTLAVAAPTLSLLPVAGALPGATAGLAYRQALQVDGGVAPYTATLTGALPAGLAFDGTTLAFSGTPVEAGRYTVTVTVTDSTSGAPASASATYTLDVAAPTLALAPDTLPAATGGVAWRQTFTASGGVAPYRYALASGALPDGLALDPASGALSGTPTAAGSFTFAITATDSTAGTAGTVTVEYVLVVTAPEIVIDPDTLPEALQAFEYAQALSARGGTAPYAFAIDAGTLPAGLALSDDGILSGTPAEDGTFEFTARATDALGFSGTRRYALVVIARPDPTRDPEVRGLLDAQAAATRRFASSQIGNFQQRLEQLHGRSGTAGHRNGITLASREQCPDNRFYAIEHPCHASNRSRWRDAGTDDRLAPENEPGGRMDAGGTPAAFGTWAGGTLRSGSFDGQAGGRGFDFETEGVSAGIDTRLQPNLVVGAGLGYGQDSTTIGEHGSHLRGKAWTLALYGSLQPRGSIFIDGLVGYQRLDFDLERYLTATGGSVQGRRDGDQLFASLSVGTDIARDAWQFTPYARLDAMRGALARYTEQGDETWALSYGGQDVDTTTGNLGLRMQFRQGTGWGAFSPQLRVEYQHDLTAAGGASMRYADGLGPVYFTEVDGFDRSRLMLGLGLLFDLGRYSIQVDYRGVVGSGEQRDNAVQLMFQGGR